MKSGLARINKRLAEIQREMDGEPAVVWVNIMEPLEDGSQRLGERWNVNTGERWQRDDATGELVLVTPLAEVTT